MTIYVSGQPILGIATLNSEYPDNSTYEYIVLPTNRYNDVYSLLLRLDKEETVTFDAYTGFGRMISVNAESATFTGT
jgi:hypothetical protein